MNFKTLDELERYCYMSDNPELRRVAEFLKEYQPSDMQLDQAWQEGYDEGHGDGYDEGYDACREYHTA